MSSSWIALASSLLLSTAALSQEGASESGGAPPPETGHTDDDVPPTNAPPPPDPPPSRTGSALAVAGVGLAGGALGAASCLGLIPVVLVLGATGGTMLPCCAIAVAAAPVSVAASVFAGDALSSPVDDAHAQARELSSHWLPFLGVGLATGVATLLAAPVGAFIGYIVADRAGVPVGALPFEAYVAMSIGGAVATFVVGAAGGAAAGFLYEGRED